jgi:hypothetical protein
LRGRGHLWGPNASSDKLRAGARCTSCGGKGAALQRPGWAGNHIGFYAFPSNAADEGSVTDARDVEAQSDRPKHPTDFAGSTFVSPRIFRATKAPPPLMPKDELTRPETRYATAALRVTVCRTSKPSNLGCSR